MARRPKQCPHGVPHQGSICLICSDPDVQNWLGLVENGWPFRKELEAARNKAARKVAWKYGLPWPT